MQLYLLKHVSVMGDQMLKFIFVILIGCFTSRYVLISMVIKFRNESFNFQLIIIGCFTSRYVLNSLVIKFRNESSNFQLIIKMHTA